MNSIKKLAVQFNCNPFDLNKILVKYEIPVSTVFGIDDGFVSDDLHEHIQHELLVLENTSLTADEILCKKRDSIELLCLGSYVYFLIKNDLIVYVGQTTCLLNRIFEHHKSKKDFNFITYIEVSKKKLLSVEAHYIKKINPHYNISGVNSLMVFESIIKSF